jgi:hypothetical protein
MRGGNPAAARLALRQAGRPKRPRSRCARCRCFLRRGNTATLCAPCQDAGWMPGTGPAAGSSRPGRPVPVSEHPTCERCGADLPDSHLFHALRSQPRICRGCLPIADQIAEQERQAEGAKRQAQRLEQDLRAAREVERWHRGRAAKLREREAKMRELEVPVQESQRPSDEKQD